ncbi:MAG: cytochrome P460 family protein [Candidatus Kuenenia sp.]|nr:cytochrome P460 family protein [Candidatus Kuenenia hertensis]
MKKIHFIVLLAIILLQIRCGTFKQKIDVKEAAPESKKEKIDIIEVIPVNGKEKISPNEKIANELWYYIGNKICQNNWKMWPGKTAFYEGEEKEHHGSLSTTYVNDIAYEVIENKKGLMPPGATIVKENYTADKALESITVMHKAEGFHPDTNDWFWIKFEPNGKVIAMVTNNGDTTLSDKVAECIGCHKKQIDNDYIFTSPLKKKYVY